MKLIDKVQEKNIRLLFGAVAFLGGVTALLLYFQRRKFAGEQKELLNLEKEIKTLELEELRKNRQSRK